ncbi:hypothetical protein [Chryseosolibacter indicus]|uniref:TonB-dependent receptor n=1 Tax=Chryseosolibacter indicus TaxID=2782351 RepID=A0ABS5VQ36_9BACT|nr:hypothetical protein [Chryseosolibacter indicus]MBT1703461.1 hypothetical protein [Chryseosolibacter indicus]
MSTNAFAQGQWGNEGELEDVEIEIVKERQITLPKANRNFEKIPPRPSEPIKAPVQYDFKPFNFQTAPINPAIKPLKIKQEDPSKVYGGYLSAGFGNYTSPYLEGFVNSTRDKNKLIGAHGLFSASDKGPVDGKNSGSGMSKLSVFGKTFNETFALSGDVGFENRTTHFYGYPEGTDIDAKDIKQYYNHFRINGEISNARNTAFSYKLGGTFGYLANKYDARESEVNLSFDSRYKLDDERGIGLKAGYNLLNRKDAEVEAKPRNLFFVNPQYQFLPIEDLSLIVGLVAAVENDSIDSKNVHVYPDIRAAYPLSPSVKLTASLTGGIEKVSLQSLSNENIWIAPNVPIFHTNKLYDLQGALHTKLGNKIGINGGLSIAALKNWYFFVNSITDQSRFDVVYDTKATVRTNFFASVGYSQSEGAKILLRGDVYGYNTKNVGEAWHRPTYKVTGDASFNIVKKILLDVTLIAQGGMKALEPSTDKVVTIDPAFDLNVRFEYLFSDSFSFFAQLNNITSNNYQTYLYYPVRGFQGMGGITWSF